MHPSESRLRTGSLCPTWRPNRVRDPHRQVQPRWKCHPTWLACLDAEPRCASARRRRHDQNPAQLLRVPLQPMSGPHRAGGGALGHRFATDTTGATVPVLSGAPQRRQRRRPQRPARSPGARVCRRAERAGFHQLYPRRAHALCFRRDRGRYARDGRCGASVRRTSDRGNAHLSLRLDRQERDGWDGSRGCRAPLQPRPQHFRPPPCQRVLRQQ